MAGHSSAADKEPGPRIRQAIEDEFAEVSRAYLAHRWRRRREWISDDQWNLVT